MADHDFLRGLEDDGLYTPSVKRHSLRKIEIHNYYVSLFSTAMNNQWLQRAYLGLYSGAGRARVAETDEIVETTVMSAFRVRDPFTKYIFVDNDRRCIEALEGRISALDDEHDVSLIRRDVCEAVPEIIRAMPAESVQAPDPVRSEEVRRGHDADRVSVCEAGRGTRDRDSIPSWVLGCPRPPTGSASTDADLAGHAVTRNEYFV